MPSTGPRDTARPLDAYSEGPSLGSRVREAVVSPGERRAASRETSGVDLVGRRTEEPRATSAWRPQRVVHRCCPQACVDSVFMQANLWIAMCTGRWTKKLRYTTCGPVVAGLHLSQRPRRTEIHRTGPPQGGHRPRITETWRPGSNGERRAVFLGKLRELRMTTQQERRDRETDRRTPRQPRDRATGGWHRDAAAESSAAKPSVRRRQPAVQQGPSDAYFEGPSLLSGEVSGTAPRGSRSARGADVGTRSTETDGLAPGPSVKMTPRSGGTSE